MGYQTDNKLIDDCLYAMSRQSLEVQRQFLYEALTYSGASFCGISILDDDKSPNRIKTPAILADGILYEGRDRVGQYFVLAQKRYIRDILSGNSDLIGRLE